MSESNPRPVEILQVHPVGQLQYTAGAESGYSTFLSAVDSRFSGLRYRSKEIPVSRASTQAFSQALNRALAGSKSPKVLVIELLDRDPDPYLRDLLCLDLFQALRQRESDDGSCIIFAVAHPKALDKSVVLGDFLLPLCRERQIAVILLPRRPPYEPRLLCSGFLDENIVLPALGTTFGERLDWERAYPPMTAEEIRAGTDLLFGHFLFHSNDDDFHLPILASVRRLAADPKFIRHLRTDLENRLGDDDFAVLPFGVPLGGINELAVTLVEGRAERLLGFPVGDDHSFSSAVILCDIIGPMYPLAEAVECLASKRCSNVIIFGIARLLAVPDVNQAEQHSYLELPFRATNKQDDCSYCKHDVRASKGRDFEEFAKNMGDFDPFTFWEFVRQDSNYYSIGHWPSPITPNHYQFRILTEPIFQTWGFDIASRFRNRLEHRGIIPSWVRKIVVPGDKEAILLAQNVARSLGLRADDDIVSIPRDVLSSVAGQDISREAMALLENDSIAELQGKHVLVIDQAAHHLRTLSALRSICQQCGAFILAYLMFIDRTDHLPLENGYLYGSHYVKLYSWPCAPMQEWDCPCAKEGEA